MTRNYPATISLQREDFDVAAEQRKLSQGHDDIGAVVAFTGICRGGASDDIVAMTLEYYPGMAEEEIARHVVEAEQRWALKGVTVIHRYGRMVPGDNIVLVLTASAHRGDAFAAAEFLMDYLKTSAPFWKREEHAGAGPEKSAWVEARDADQAAADRWNVPQRGRTAAE